MKRITLILLLFFWFAPANASQLCADPTPDNRLDGYCQLGYFVPGEITSSTYWMPPPTFFRTRTYYYAQRLMGETARLKGFDGSEEYVALLSPAALGWRVWIRLPGQDWIPVRVADDVARDDYYYHAVITHSAMEVSYSLAERLGIIDWVNPDGSRYPVMDVCVTESDPNGVCTGDPVNYEDWFRSVVDFEKDN